MNRLLLTMMLFVLCLLAESCNSIESHREYATIIKGFLPENKAKTEDMDILKQKIEQIINESNDAVDSWIKAEGQMTWKQACELYKRSSNRQLKEWLAYPVFSARYDEKTQKYYHPFGVGIWTKKDIIRLLGFPDAIAIGKWGDGVDDWGEKFTYTGGYDLRFNSDGYYCGMGIPP